MHGAFDRLKQLIPTGSRIYWTALVVLMVLTAWLRLGLVDVPLERDEGEYAYAGQLILQGVAPYKAVHNMKLPGVYAAYAIILELFGQTHEGIHGALIVVNLMTGLFLFLLVRRLCGDPRAVVAAACFYMLSIGRSVQGIFANAEHFVMLFAVTGLYALMVARSSDKRRGYFLSGLLLGTAFVMKQHGAAFGLLGISVMVMDAAAKRPFQWKGLLRQSTYFALGGICPYLAVCAMLYAAGAFDDFWFWTVTYAGAYVGQLPLRAAVQNFCGNGWAIVTQTPVIWGLTAAGGLLLPSTKMGLEKKGFIILFFIFSLLATVPGFFFRPHYFVLVLPAAAVLAGLGVSQGVALLPKERAPYLRYAVAVLLPVIALGQALYGQRDYLFTLTPFQVARSVYWLNPFSESLPVADYLHEHTQADDRIVVLGSEPQIYFYARRASANGFIYMYPLMEKHEFALEMQKKFTQSVEAARPKYVVFINVPTSWLFQRDSHQHLLQWFDGYQRQNLKLEGLVELYDDRAEYFWKDRLKWPATTRFWIAVFKNKSAA